MDVSFLLIPSRQLLLQLRFTLHIHAARGSLCPGRGTEQKAWSSERKDYYLHFTGGIPRWREVKRLPRATQEVAGLPQAND